MIPLSQHGPILSTDFPIYGATFDGTDYLERTTTLGSVSSPTSILGSFWIRPNLSDTSQRVIIARNRGAGGAGLTVEFQGGTSILIITAINAAGTTTVFNFTGPTLSNSAWHHVLFAYDSGTLTGKLYIDDSYHSDPTTNLGGTIGNPSSTQIGSFVSTSANNLNGGLAEVWIGYGQFSDITVTANRRKFITAAGKPALLGSDGSGPTGTRPTIYFRGGETEFATNRGLGGTFTQTGTLATSTQVTL